MLRIRGGSWPRVRAFANSVYFCERIRGVSDRSRGDEEVFDVFHSLLEEMWGRLLLVGGIFVEDCRCEGTNSSKESCR